MAALASSKNDGSNGVLLSPGGLLSDCPMSRVAQTRHASIAAGPGPSRSSSGVPGELGSRGRLISKNSSRLLPNPQLRRAEKRETSDSRLAAIINPAYTPMRAALFWLVTNQ